MIRQCQKPMDRRGVAVALVFTIAVCWSPASPAAVSQDLETLSWLVGCWRMETPGTVVEEYWMAPNGDSMLGMSRTVREGQLVGYELLLLIQTEGGLVYRAHPSGQAMANFQATEASRRGVVFENPTHDFPRRIAYWPKGTDGLAARVDDGSDKKSFELEYRRTGCPAQPGQ